MITGKFPLTRMRRNRVAPWIRSLVQENALSVKDLIWPLFVHDMEEPTSVIGSMPGVERYSVRRIVDEAKRAADLGIPAIAVFPYIRKEKKNSSATEALNSDNVVCRAVAAIKEHVPTLGVICDAALDPFTNHGHDGILVNGVVANDETIEVLCKQSIIQARAGCDAVAPSDMMDGRVLKIRQALDSEGFSNVLILAYSAKYASAFYGPFRDAVGSDTLMGKDKELGYRDKSTYQLNPANSNEGIREVAHDIQEGADIVMIKPGLPYLDIISRVKEKFGVPTFAYQVSGEYSMMCAAFDKGYLDRKRSILESLICFKRAGADGVLTYFAREVAEYLG